jgi:hypothetical protein
VTVRPHRIRELVLAIVGTACLGLVGGAGVLTPAFARSSGVLINAAGHRFAPVLGDWEGTSGGLHASFEIVANQSFSTRYGTPSFGLTDLVAMQPVVHGGILTTTAVASLAENVVSPVLRNGGFGGPSDINGGLTARTKAWVRTRSGSTTILWHLHPATRRAVRQGLWRLRFSDGETAQVHVVAGGRVLDSTAFPPAALLACGIHGGSPDLDFISPAGAVSDPQPRYGLTFKLALRASFGQGEVKIASPTCTHTTLPMTATRLGGAQPKTRGNGLAGRGEVR